MSLRDEMMQFAKEHPDDDYDLDIQLTLTEYFANNPNCSTEQLTQFINDLITRIGEQFTNDTERKDVKTRIEEFNKRIYTIKHNDDVQLLTAGDDCGKILYGKIFELLQSDQFPTGKEYSPLKDKNQTMNEADLEKRDYEIRVKLLKHLADTYVIDMPLDLSADFQTIYEQFCENPEGMKNLHLGRMNIRNAAIITRVFFDAGYKVNFDDLLSGGLITTSKIPLIMDKSKETEQYAQKNSNEYHDPCFSQDVMKRIQDYVESLDGVERYFRKITGMPEIKYYDENGFEIEQQESQTPITDAMKHWGEEETKSNSVGMDPLKKAIKYAMVGSKAGAVLNNSLEGIYSNRKIRRGQIQKASENIRTSNRDKENPQVYKEEGEEYDE